MIKCREWQGWEEFLKKQITKRKWEQGKCGKAEDGRDGSAVPNGLTGSVVAGGASVHRAQCSPLIHLGKPSQTKVQIKQCPRFYCPPPMSHTSAKVDFFSEKFGEFCCRLVTPATSGMVAINRQISWHLSDIQFGKVPVDSDHYQDNFTLILFINLKIALNSFSSLISYWKPQFNIGIISPVLDMICQIEAAKKLVWNCWCSNSGFNNITIHKEHQGNKFLGNKPSEMAIRKSSGRVMIYIFWAKCWVNC